MRLLVIAPHYNTFVKGSVEAVARKLDGVDVLVHHNRFTSLARLIPLGGFFDYARRFTKDKLLNLEGKPENVRVYFISKFYFPPSSKNMRVGDIFAREMLKTVRREGLRPDVIHTHFTWPPGYIGARMKSQLRAKLVVTGHGYDVYDLPFRGEQWMGKIRWALSQADAVTTVSKSNLEILVNRLGVDRKRTHLIPNGVSSIFRPMDKEEVRRRLGIPLDAKVVLSVGSLIEVKGHTYLVKAMKKVREKENTICYIVGEGHLKESLRREIEELGLGGIVELIGPRPHSEIPLWMNAADIFVLPSLREGTPTVMLEALACGLPFIGTRVGGIPDVITSNEYGILVEPADERSLAEAILQALNREWDREKIVRYAEQFSWERIADKLISLYESLARR